MLSQLTITRTVSLHLDDPIWKLLQQLPPVFSLALTMNSVMAHPQEHNIHSIQDGTVVSIQNYPDA